MDRQDNHLLPTVSLVHSVDAIAFYEIHVLLSNDLSGCEATCERWVWQVPCSESGRSATLTNEWSGTLENLLYAALSLLSKSLFRSSYLCSPGFGLLVEESDATYYYYLFILNKNMNIYIFFLTCIRLYGATARTKGSDSQWESFSWCPHRHMPSLGEPNPRWPFAGEPQEPQLRCSNDTSRCTHQGRQKGHCRCITASTPACVGTIKL